jgi:hypothetical protein
MALKAVANTSIGLGLALIALSGGLCPAAQPAAARHPAPDFGQAEIGRAAAETLSAWNTWADASRGFELRAVRAPMAEARRMIERNLGGFLNVLDRRRAYSQAVAAYIARSRAEPAAGSVAVPLSEVYQDQIELLGSVLACYVEGLGSLRDSSEWLAVRRAALAERDNTVRLQSARRAALPDDLSLNSPRAQASITALAYRDSEREVADQLQILWTRYCQALADAIEQPAGPGTPLAPSRGAADAAPSAPALHDPLGGAWQYETGSQKFNGVDEPRRALLELWVENGALVGRYRAEIPSFSGLKTIDARLRGPLVRGAATHTLDVQSGGLPPGAKIVLEGPLDNRLMLIRVAPADPPGRELLVRR